MFENSVMAENIKRFRVKSGITQATLAESLNVSAQAISKWESGNSTPNIENLWLMADLFGVSVDSILGYPKKNNRLMVAVDGGGSKTEFVLFDEQGTVLDSCVSASTNPNTNGINNCINTIIDGINSLTVSTDLVGIYVGGSGFSLNNNKKTIQKALKRQYPYAKVSCQSDLKNVFAVSNVKEDCIVAISGTGFSIVVKKGDAIEIKSGWGYLMSKYGSGYDIGRDALYAALEYAEGFGEYTVINELIEKNHNKTPHEIFGKIYQEGASYIASFAPLVFEAFRYGDKKAKDILENNAEGTSSVINRITEVNRIKGKVVLSGSIFTQEAVFTDMIKERLNRDLEIFIPKYPPVLGACKICAEMCNIKINVLSDSFFKQYTERKGI